MRVVIALYALASAMAFTGRAVAGPVPKVSRDVVKYAREKKITAGSDSITRQNLDLLKERYLRSSVSMLKDSEELESSGIKSRTLSLPPTVWTLKPYQTFMQITLFQIGGGGLVPQLLHGAAQILKSQLQQFDGSSNILDSKFTYSLSPQLTLSMWNWNNHKIDLQVANEAIAVLYDFMAHRGFGFGTFTIYAMIPNKGAVAVGQGSIGSIPR